MNATRIRRAQLVIASISVAVGAFAILNSSFTFSGTGESGFLVGDSFFIGSLFKLNALGGSALVVAGAVGVIASRQSLAVLGWLGAAIALASAIAVLAGVGDAEAIVGGGNPSNAALFITVAIGLAVTSWAATAESRSEATAS